MAGYLGSHLGRHFPIYVTIQWCFQMQGAFLCILSKLDVIQEHNGYIAYKIYFVLYIMVSSALGTKK